MKEYEMQIVIDGDKTKSVRGNRAKELLDHISELFTKEEVIAMLTELKSAIEKHRITSGVTNQGTWNECIACCSRLIDGEINSLKENT